MSREIVASKPCMDLKLYRKIYSSVDSLYVWLYNETKEKNCLFDEALSHIGYNKLNEEFWTEGREWFRWIYKYEGEDIAGSDISSFKVERRPVLKVGGHLQLSRNWHVCLQLKAKSMKVKGWGRNRWREESAKWYDYLYLSNSMIRNAGIGLFAVRELPTRTHIGYYCSVLLWRLGQMLPYDEHTVIEPPDEETDAYTILMQDSKGEWVTVSPGGCGEPSLYMGFQFMNDIGLSFDDETENQSQVCQAMYNTQITEDGCVYTTRMIGKGTELLCAYVQERMIPEQEQANENLRQHVVLPPLSLAESVCETFPGFALPIFDSIRMAIYLDGSGCVLDLCSDHIHSFDWPCRQVSPRDIPGLCYHQLCLPIHSWTESTKTSCLFQHVLYWYFA